MADFERRSWSIARAGWLTLSVVTFLLGIAFGLVMRSSFPLLFAPSRAVNTEAGEPFDLKQWTYPQARLRIGNGGGESRVSDWDHVQSERFLPDLYTYSTPDPLEKVWAHYLTLAGINPEGNLFTSGTLASVMGPDRFSNTLASVNEPGGQPFRSATLVTHRGQYTVVAFLSRVDDGTHIELAVQQMPR